MLVMLFILPLRILALLFWRRPMPQMSVMASYTAIVICCFVHQMYCAGHRQLLNAVYPSHR